MPVRVDDLAKIGSGQNIQEKPKDTPRVVPPKGAMKVNDLWTIGSDMPEKKKDMVENSATGLVGASLGKSQLPEDIDEEKPKTFLDEIKSTIKKGSYLSFTEKADAGKLTPEDVETFKKTNPEKYDELTQQYFPSSGDAFKKSNTASVMLSQSINLTAKASNFLDAKQHDADYYKNIDSKIEETAVPINNFFAKVGIPIKIQPTDNVDESRSQLKSLTDASRLNIEAINRDKMVDYEEDVVAGNKFKVRQKGQLDVTQMSDAEIERKKFTDPELYQKLIDAKHKVQSGYEIDSVLHNAINPIQTKFGTNLLREEKNAPIPDPNKNGNDAVRNIGEQIFKLKDPDTYALYKKAGGYDHSKSFEEQSFNSDLDQVNKEIMALGYNALKGDVAANGTDAQYANIYDNLKYLDYKFSVPKEEETKHRIAAALKAKGIDPTLASDTEKDEIARTLPVENQEVWFNKSKQNNNTDLPNTGFWYSTGNAARNTLTNAMKSGSPLSPTAWATLFLGTPDDKELAQEVLRDRMKSDVLGENPESRQRYNELKQKQKDKTITLQEQDELNDLSSFTDKRSGWDKFKDGNGSMVGMIAGVTVDALPTLGGGAISRGLVRGAEVIAGEQAALKGIQEVPLIENTVANATKTLAERWQIPTNAESIVNFAKNKNEMFVIMHHDNAKRAMELFPNDDTKKAWYTGVTDVLSMAMPNLLPTHKLGKLFDKETKDIVSEFVGKLSEKNLDKAVIDDMMKETATKIINKTGTFLVGAEKTAAEASLTMSLMNLGNNVTQAILKPESISGGDIGNNFIQTFSSTFLDSQLIGLVGGKSEVQKKYGQVGVDAIYDATQSENSVNSVKYTILQQESKGELTTEQANKKISLLNTAAELRPAVDNLQREESLDANESKKIFINLLNERILKSKIADLKENGASESLIKPLENRIAEINDINSRIINKEIKVNDNYAIVEDAKEGNITEQSKTTQDGNKKTDEEGRSEESSQSSEEGSKKSDGEKGNYVNQEGATETKKEVAPLNEKDAYTKSIDAEEKGEFDDSSNFNLKGGGRELWEMTYTKDESGINTGDLGVTEKGELGTAVNISDLQKRMIEDAIKEGRYEEAIKKGTMSAGYAKRIIESAGLEVPQDIIIDAGIQKNKVNEKKEDTTTEEPTSIPPEYNDFKEQSSLKGESKGIGEDIKNPKKPLYDEIAKAFEIPEYDPNDTFWQPTRKKATEVMDWLKESDYTNKYEKELLSKYQEHIDPNLEITFDNSQPINRGGGAFYKPGTNTLTRLVINPKAVGHEGTTVTMQGALLHELTHALVKNGEKELYGKLGDLFDMADKYINENKKNLLDQYGNELKITYGLSGINEFVAEAMSNRTFQSVLSNIKYKNESKTVWQKFTDAVKDYFSRLLGTKDENVLNEVVKSITKHISENTQPKERSTTKTTENNDFKKQNNKYSSPKSEKGKAAINEAIERREDVEKAGFDFLEDEENPNPTPNTVAIGNVGVNWQEHGKGLGTLGYILKGEEYLKEGKSIISKPEGRTEQATGVWKKLIRLGLAEETSPGYFRYGGERENNIGIKKTEDIGKDINNDDVIEDFYFKNSDELKELQQKAKEKSRQALIDATSEQWYKKYQFATNEEKSKMEDALTPEQKKVFGGFEVLDRDNPEVLGALRKKIGVIEVTEGKETLASVVRQAITDLANGRNKKESIAVLNAAAKRSEELGIDKNEIQSLAIKDLRDRIGDEDAASILNTFFNKQKPDTPVEKIIKDKTDFTDTKEVTEKNISTKSTQELTDRLKYLKSLSDKSNDSSGSKGGAIIREKEAKMIMEHLSKRYGIESVLEDMGMFGSYGLFDRDALKIKINRETTLDKSGKPSAAFEPTGNISRRTIFHEYLHPFVDVLASHNKELYDELYIKAIELNKKEKFADVDHYPQNKQKEEMVVRMLDRLSDSDMPPSLLQKFFKWLSELFYSKRKNNSATLEKLSKDTTPEQLYKIFKNYGNLKDDILPIIAENRIKKLLEFYEKQLNLNVAKSPAEKDAIKKTIERLKNELSSLDLKNPEQIEKEIKLIESELSKRGVDISKYNEGVKETNIPIGETKETTGEGESPVEADMNPEIYAEDRNTILSHRGLQEVATEFGLDDVTARDRVSDLRELKNAETTIDKWVKEGVYSKRVEELIKTAEDKKPLNTEEQLILEQHIANVADKVRKIREEKGINSKEYDEAFKVLNRLKEAGQTVRSTLGAALRIGSNRGSKANPTVEDYLVEETALNNQAPLTENQKNRVEKEYTEISKAEQAFQEKIAALEAENARLMAEKEIKKSVPVKKSKKTTEDFKEERKSITEKLKEEVENYKKSFNKLGISSDGNVESFVISAKMAKLVGQLAKSYVEQGVSKLSEVTSKVLEEIKGIVGDSVNEKDVHNIIAGEYNEKKPTKNEITQRLEDLRIEAKLINKLEKLKNGGEPKSEKKQIKRNMEIESLRQQIKGFKTELHNENKKIEAAKKEEEKLVADFEKEKNDIEKKKMDEAIRKQRQLVKDLEKRTPEESALQAMKTRTQNKIDRLTDELVYGNFDKEPKKEPLKLDEEALKLKDNLVKLKNERAYRLLQRQYQNQTTYQKAERAVVRGLNVPRSLMSTLDFSAVLRQAVIPAISNPNMARKAMTEMFKSTFSQKNYDRWLYDLHQSPRYDLMKDSKLAITDSTSHDLQAREEVFMDNLVDRIPAIGELTKGSERAYSQFLNKMRVDLFNRFADSMEKRGLTFKNSPEQFKQMAAYVNNSTGRGDLGNYLNKAAPILNSLFFSPRLIASRLNMLTYLAQPRFYKTVPREVRLAYFKDMASFIGVGLTVLALAKLNGADVEDDPRSSDFGKIKSGNTRWDIWGGFQQYARLGAQLLTGQSKSSVTGDINELDGKGMFGRDRGDVLTSMLRGKLAPVPSIAWDLIKGRNIVGEKISLTNWNNEEDEDREGREVIGLKEYLKQHFLPLTYTGLEDALKDQDIKAIFTVGIPSLFGVGTQTYGEK